ncbi:MAG TPA: aminotransferase class I/II-fold pyridoxal phosphate-dependent enzyme [Vicinamibacteria bacterium]
MNRDGTQNSRLAGFGTSVFAEYTALATEHGAINLGQGYPDFDGPDFVKDAAMAAIREGHNQYSPMIGLLDLRRAVAEHQERFYGLRFDPDHEVTVYAGATEAIFSTLQAILEAGDEVVLFSPYYDSYPAGIAMAGASPRVVTLRGDGFRLHAEDREAAMNPRTRAIMVNTPLTPAGKVFSPDELEIVAAACRRHDLLAVTDEVYEHLVFDGAHVPLASLPGMRERTVTISSTGKTFSLTGWKIGYTCAPAELTRALRTAHQFVTFAVNTPGQVAMAVALRAPDAYFASFRAEYRARRDRLCAGLRGAGFVVTPPAGTYFAVADIRPLGFDDDVAFCRMLPKRCGVAAIPISAFQDRTHAVRHLVRFAFCKTDAMLDEGLRRLLSLKEGSA